MDEAWYYVHEGRRGGPITAEGLRDLAGRGGLAAEDLVWRPGLEGWVQACRARGLGLRRSPGFDACSTATGQASPPAQDDRDLEEPGGRPHFSEAWGLHASDDDQAFEEPRLADFRERFAAHLIDAFICLPAMMLAFVVLTFVCTLGAMMDLALHAADAPLGTSLWLYDLATGWLFAYALVVMLPSAYAAFMEASPLQATVGKLMLNIKVTDVEGRRLLLGRALGRSLAKIWSIGFCSLLAALVSSPIVRVLGISPGLATLAMLFFLLIASAGSQAGFILAIWTPRKQALHDMLADTIVVSGRR